MRVPGAELAAAQRDCKRDRHCHPARRRASVRKVKGSTMSDPATSHNAPRGALTVRTIAMPDDTNANGDIFGGWVMAHMDQAGGIAGVERAQGRVVTVVVEAMKFIRAMRVGDVLEVYTEVESVGRTSMKIHIEAWAQRFQTHNRDLVPAAPFPFFPLGEDGGPKPIPPVAR